MFPPAQPHLLPHPSAAVPTRVLLVAEDAPGETDALRDALEESGYGVAHARSTEAAQACPDIVLLDVGRPAIDAFEVARWLEADAATALIPVIFLAALDQTDAVVGAFGVGVVDYIVKPVRLRELIARMESHLRTARAVAAHRPQAPRACVCQARRRDAHRRRGACAGPGAGGAAALSGARWQQPWEVQNRSNSPR